ncbi:hypothetical protein RhiJN_23919 [Ceratobasidium sp. AG-Ba]|nr:hypothetical protein RhiJN_23919 [Ceratobasidium sp. AG-Ba]
MTKNKYKGKRSKPKEHKKRPRDDDSKPHRVLLTIKRQKKATTVSEDELEAGPFDDPAGSVEVGYEDEDAMTDFNQAEHEEFLADPNADKEELEEGEHAERDSTEPEPVPEVELLFLIPKEGSTASTPCKLPSTVSFVKFQKLVSQKANITDFDDVEISYKLNNRPTTQRPQCLDTLEEYQHMVQEVSHMVISLKGNKKSPLPIKIFVKKRDPTPEPPKSKNTGKGSNKRNHQSKGSTNSDGETAKSSDNVWMYLRKIKAEYPCGDPGHTHCYILPGNIHHELTTCDFSVWSMAVEEGRATLTQPPPALKLSWLDQAPKQRGMPVAQPPGPVLRPATPALAPAPALPPVAAPAPPASDLASIASIFHDLVAVIQNPVAQPPAPPTLPLPEPAQASQPDDKNDNNIEFPTIRDWVETISDIHPRLKPHVTTLEAKGYTNVNHLVLTGLSVKDMKEDTGINLVDIILLCRLASEIVKEARLAA